MSVDLAQTAVGGVSGQSMGPAAAGLTVIVGTPGEDIAQVPAAETPSRISTLSVVVVAHAKRLL